MNRLNRDKAVQGSPALPLLTLQDVSVTYEDGQRTILHHIDLTLNKGETVLLAGPSGSGKSTLVQLCAGLIPDAVEARVEGAVLRDEALMRPGGVGMVFQDPETQFCMLEARDELAFGLENRKIPRGQMPAQMKQALASVRWWPSPMQSHRQISGGQKQKLAIAAALTMEPELLILDEPTSNLDPAATATMMEQIRHLRQQGQTMLLIEHKLEYLEDVVDRVVLLSADGRIERIGTPADVFRQYGDWLIEQGITVPWAWDQQQNANQSIVPPLEQANPPLAAPAVQLDKGTVRYGKKTVLQDLNVSIPAGTFTAIVGPNGAGKSTLLQALAGVIKLSGGSVDILGRESDRKGKLARDKIAYVFQNPELQFMYDLVADELGNQRYGGVIPQEIEDELSAFGLSGTAQQSPYALSQGQKRRLSVAEMLRADKEIYMLDEPTYGQDPKTQEAILNVLRQKQREGRTVVITTHDMNIVKQFAAHVLVLKGGQLLFAGSPTDLWTQSQLLAAAHLDGAPERDDEAHAAGDEVARSLWDELPVKPKHRLVDYFNPALLVLTMIFAGSIGTYTQSLRTAAALFVLSLVWLTVFTKMTPWRLVKWYAPFALIYVFYLWSFAAYTAVPKGVPSYHFLWMNMSWYGLHLGLVVALRLLSSIGYVILLIVGIDAAELIVSLCQNVRVAPKLAYGILAGMRLAPMFQDEWRQLTLARALRGRSSRFAFLKPIQYSLPLLSMAVRQSERVAVAMEARGLVGRAANHASARTYLRLVRVRIWDWLALVVVIGSVIAVIAGIASAAS